MFGSQNTYGGYNNSYGNAPYYPPASNPDSFWGNKQQQQSQNRVNYRNQDDAIANDSIYGYQNNNSYPEQSIDGSIESGLSGLSIEARHSEEFGPPSFASISSQKTTSWASIASQPAKSQPKSLKSKMAASGLMGSTSKHLPPTVALDVSWGSKSNGKSVPPPPVVASPPAAPIPPAVVPNRAASPVEELPSPVIQHQQQQQQQLPQPSPPQRPLNHPSKENSWTSNGNSSSSGSISTSASSPRPSQPPPNLPKANNNGNMRGPMNEINENYNPNKYSNQRNQHQNYHNYQQPPPPPQHHYNNNNNNNNNSYHNMKPLLDNPPYSSRGSGPAGPAVAATVPAPAVVRDVPPVTPPASSGNICEEMSRADLEKLFDENDYNPKEFDLNPQNARFFIIKSYSEDDVHRSIKYSIWCSTDHGNKRLDTAFRLQEGKGPIYLLYSVNRSGHFCGVAQMMSPVDYNASAGVWAQDKWKGQFQVKWIYVKDVPNDELRHITLENNENKPVTNSRDTQEVPYEKGKKVLAIIHKFVHRTSIFDDFLHYEKKQEEEQRKPDLPPSPPPVNNYMKMANSQYHSGPMPPRDNQMPFRGGNGNYGKPNRPYPDSRDQRDHRNEFRNDYRNDHLPRGNEYGRPERNDYRGDRMDRLPAEQSFGRERNMEPRGDYRDGGREYREYREPHREQQFHRDQYARDFHQQPQREYLRERNDYPRPQQEHREFRDNRERVSHERNQQQSWRN